MSSFVPFTKGVTDIFNKTWHSTKPIVIHQGGTSSGKTFGIMQYLVAKCISEKAIRCIVIGQDVPNLKRGAWADIENIFSIDTHLKQFVEKINNTDRVYYFRNGSRIEFTSLENYQSAKSGKREYSFFNEANGIGYEVFFEIEVRTTRKTIIDFNPNEEFWVHTQVWKPPILGADGKPEVDDMGIEQRKVNPDVDFFISTWRDNKFLPQKIIDGIEALKYSNPEKYKVYGLGEVGVLEGLVFKNVEVIDKWPEEIMLSPHRFRVSQGLDFGWNDPAAMSRRAVMNNCLYLDELLYAKQLRLPQLIPIVKENTLADTYVWADAARPDLIVELQLAGCEVIAAKKGQGSIKDGIELMQSYDKIYITKRSTWARKEFSNYVWVKDKDGLNKTLPIDKWNHFIDSCRYAELMNKYVSTELFADYDPNGDDGIQIINY